jgi:serine protease DegQ
MTLKPRTIILLILGVVAGVVLTGRLSLTQPSLATPTETGMVEQAPMPRASGSTVPSGPLPDLSTVAENALKSSVSIASTSVQEINDPFYRMFSGSQFQRSQSSGSGVVVSADGYILTNTHVIGNADATVRVTLPDGQQLPGRLTGIDDISDLAVVKIEAKNLQPLPFGDSARLRVAEWVLAIGNPFQLAGTVTLGIVSTVSRPGAQVGAYADFIQTDAAINPGNSGGALVNARGELIGINTLILSESGGNQGLGFAIPSNLARRIMDDLKANGSVTWGSVGTVQWVTMNRRVAADFGLDTARGALVYRMDRASSAARAGLEAGDVVTSVNGQEITDADQIDRLVIGAKVGSTLKMAVVKQNGRKAAVDVPVVSRSQLAPRRPR